jgi:hypothetical protein
MRKIKIRHVCRKIEEENDIDADGIEAPYRFDFAISFWDEEDDEILQEDVIVTYKVLSEGCEELVFNKGGYQDGYPAPVVEYTVNDDVDPEVLLRQVNQSQVVITSPSSTEYVFSDMNGYTHLLED